MSDAGRRSGVRIVAAGHDDWVRVRSLRLAALADAPDAFEGTLVDERDRPENVWRERLAQADATTFVAVVDGPDDARDAGIAVVAPSFEDRTVAALYSVWVDPSARGLGVAAALIAAAVDHARHRGYERMVLDVGDHNAAAHRAYERAGFRVTGRTSHLAPPRENVTEHEMEIDLRAEA